VGVAIGAGGTFLAINSAPKPYLATDEQQDPVIIVKTQVVTIAAAPRPSFDPREDRGGPEEQVVSFRPQDEGTSGTNESRRAPWPERGTQEWSNRVAEFRAVMSNRLTLFRAEWTNRAAAERTNFLAVTKLNEEQAVRFDVLMTAMNVRLASVLDPIIAQAQSGNYPRLNTQERIRLNKAIADALVNTYDEMNRSMPADWSSNASSNHIRLTQFVQPEYYPFVDRVAGRNGGGDRGGWGGDRGGWGGRPGGVGQQPGGPQPQPR
jgi:hypothetical protein